MVAAMGGEFRFVFYPSDYERSVEFYRDELGLLSMAYAFEQATQHGTRRPAVGAGV